MNRYHPRPHQVVIDYFYREKFPVPNNPAPGNTVTRAELAVMLERKMTSESPVKFAGYFSLINLVNETVDQIIRERKAKVTLSCKPPAPVEVEIAHRATITVAELAAALTRRNYSHTDANRIYEDIVANREPEWTAGDVVKDSVGRVYQRDYTGNKWLRPGVTAEFDHDYPARPLKKMT